MKKGCGGTLSSAECKRKCSNVLHIDDEMLESATFLKFSIYKTIRAKAEGIREAKEKDRKERRCDR